MTLVIVVTTYNFLFGLACLMIAKRLWRFQHKVAIIADRILSVEQAVHRVLYPAPNALRRAQASTSRLRDYYHQLGIQYERVQQIISILSLAQLFLRYGRLVMPRSPSAPKQKSPK